MIWYQNPNDQAVMNLTYYPYLFDKIKYKIMHGCINFKLKKILIKNIY